MSNLKRFALILAVLVVLMAGFLAVTAHRASAATVCSPATAVSVPYAKDGVADICVVATSLCGYINSWNLTTLEVNGKPLDVKAGPLSYIAVRRTWADGDTVTLNLPMRVAVRKWAKNKDSVSVDYGPLTFALKIGEKGEPKICCGVLNELIVTQTSGRQMMMTQAMSAMCAMNFTFHCSARA